MHGFERSASPWNGAFELTDSRRVSGPFIDEVVHERLRMIQDLTLEQRCGPTPAIYTSSTPVYVTSEKVWIWASIATVSSSMTRPSKTGACRMPGARHLGRPLFRDLRCSRPKSLASDVFFFEPDRVVDVGALSLSDQMHVPWRRNDSCTNAVSARPVAEFKESRGETSVGRKHRLRPESRSLCHPPWDICAEMVFCNPDQPPSIEEDVRGPARSHRCAGPDSADSGTLPGW